MSSPDPSANSRTFNRPRATRKNVSVCSRTSPDVEVNARARARRPPRSGTRALTSTFRLISSPASSRGALLLVERRSRRQGVHRGRAASRLIRRGGRMRVGAIGSPLAAWIDVVPLDHLVQRRGLDVEQLGGAFLDTPGSFERRFDEPLLEVGDDVLE